MNEDDTKQEDTDGEKDQSDLFADDMEDYRG
jgi:hypothetical protein